LTSSDVSCIGLCLDVIGAFFLAESFLLKRREDIARDSGTYFGSNPFMLRSALSQAIEARIGFGFLGLGFVGQFLSQSGWFAARPARAPTAIVVVALVLWCVAFVVVRLLARNFSRRAVARAWKESMIPALQQPDTQPPEHRQELATLWGSVLFLAQGTDETDDAFVQRVIDGLVKWGS
jgi:hypothetical protein